MNNSKVNAELAKADKKAKQATTWARNLRLQAEAECRMVEEIDGKQSTSA